MNPIQLLVWMRVGYMLLAAGLLWLIQLKFPKPGSGNYSERRWRSVFLFRILNGLLVLGYILIILYQPLWLYLQPALPIVMAFIADDCLSLLLLTLFLLYFFCLSYQSDRKSKPCKAVSAPI